MLKNIQYTRFDNWHISSLSDAVSLAFTCTIARHVYQSRIYTLCSVQFVCCYAQYNKKLHTNTCRFGTRQEFLLGNFLLELVSLSPRCLSSAHILKCKTQNLSHFFKYYFLLKRKEKELAQILIEQCL